MKKYSKLLTLFTIVLIASFFISSCNSNVDESGYSEPELKFDLVNAKSEIESANKDFMALILASDTVGLGKLYTEDGKFMMNGAPAISGRKAIQSVFSGIINSGITKANLKTIEVWGQEGQVVEEGELTLFAGDAQADQGKYIVLWKKEEGKWKLHRDIFNSNLPVE